MAVNEITKNFLVYAIRDFSFAVAAVTLFSNMFLLKKFIIQTFFTIQSKGEILSSLVLKNIPSISLKKHYLYLKSTFALYNYNAFSYLIIFINLICIHLLRHHFLLLHHRYLYCYETLQILLVQK